MSSTGVQGAEGSESLRERLPNDPARPRQATSVDDARSTVEQLNGKPGATTNKKEDDKRTYGRTPDGTVFTVPQTHDMVSQLFDPTQPKNASDAVVIVVLAFHIGLLIYLPTSIRIPIFGFLFLSWRAAYNAGIGWLLYGQSNHRKLTSWAKRSGIFEKPATGNNPYPLLYKVMKREMEAKIPKDYKFEDAPLEYNTWLLFRRLVDLILMSDFTSYCCFAIACGGRPSGENVAMTIARWTSGIILVLFNLWVKLDAHRVVKDYAWYWGDFFFLIDQELTFDGVFEMAPHPMYSVGYAGFYGISLLAASYKVLFVSIVAHAAQFVFLALVENPHIEMTYNPPRKPVKKQSRLDLTKTISNTEGDDRFHAPEQEAGHVNGYPPLASTLMPSHVHNVVGIQNTDLHRVTDVSIFITQFLLVSVAMLSPSTPLWQAYFVLLATISRLWYTLGIGFILDRQSKKKKWTRHFVKYGESTEEAWRQWKGIYHFSMTFTTTAFACAAWKMYYLPADWSYGMATLRHILGFSMVTLQVWTVVSIYESLGEFGWFFGDFFFTQNTPGLTYSGIYRFLNNPERVIGLAGLWGVAIITWSKAIFFLALLSHALTLFFIQFIERPHMQKLYGESLRVDSGVSRGIKRSLPPRLRDWKGSVDRVLDETLDSVEELIDSIRPKLAAAMDAFVRDSRILFKQYPARITISRMSPDVAGFNPKDYSLTISGETLSPSEELSSERTFGREAPGAQAPQRYHPDAPFRPLHLQYGAPITVCWQAPANHNSKDWIGLYMVADNASREVTRLSSQGRWVATNRDAYDTRNAEAGIVSSDRPAAAEGRVVEGEVVFAGDKLWWTEGVFEFRYHHAGGHNVMAVSLPFEVRVGKFDGERVMTQRVVEDGARDHSVRRAVEDALLPVVRNCFDRDPDFAPETADEKFGSIEREGRYARRVVFAVQMMFGIEFAPEVVLADGSVRNLAWRITNAKRVLQPYSMTPTKGRAQSPA